MNADQFLRWLQQQSTRLRQMGEQPNRDLLDCEEAADIVQEESDHLRQQDEHPELDLCDYEEAAEIVQEARQRALDHHFAEAYEAGKTRGGPLSIELARSVLSRMISALSDPNQGPSEVNNPVLTPKEVAARLGTKASTVRGWISSGKLRAANIGHRRNRYVIRESDLDAFLGNHQVLTPQRRVNRQRNGFKRY